MTQEEKKIDKVESWSEPKDGIIHVPDWLDPLVNKIGFQFRFHTISGKNEIEAICDAAWNAHNFFHNHYEPKIATLTARVEALQKFKDYVHGRLDAAGIEKEPNGEHSKAGCRIGDRLDIILGIVEELTRENARLEEGLRSAKDHMINYRDQWRQLKEENARLTERLKAFEKKKQPCPFCKSENVIMFTSDDDMCKDCKRVFTGS